MVGTTDISRRTFLATAVLAGVARVNVAGEPAGRRLDFRIAGGFGGAGAADIEAVIRSAADAIWHHCPNTRWEVPGFHVYRDDRYPITLNAHRADGRIAIGLNTGDTFWAQYAFQFAHEFCHALAGHSNEWRKLHIEGERPNHWLEESLCEAASLFALRAMGESWKTKPPYSNWKSFAPHLTSYAQDRIDKSTAALGDKLFSDWFRTEEASLRAGSTQREKNNIVALKLLPLFEAKPSGWESVTFYNRDKSDPALSLAGKFAQWKKSAPAAHGDFIADLAKVFGVKI